MNAFQKFGDWDIVMNLCRNMPEDIKASNRQTLLVLAGKAEALAKKHINAQDLKWAPLNPEYVAQKVQKGYDERTLLRKHDYINSITHFLSDQGMRAHAGVPKNAKSDGELIYKYAAIMEFGSVVRGIPARPLWAPVLKEIHEYVRENSIFSKGVIKAFRKRTGK